MACEVHEPVMVASSATEPPKIQPIPNTPQKKNSPLAALLTDNWLSKVGIVTLVLGVAFFVKYAIDQNWIGEIGVEGVSRYDLESFRDKLSADLPVVATSEPVFEAEVKPVVRVRFFERTWFLWSVMVLAGAALVMVCLTALRKKKI